LAQDGEGDSRFAALDEALHASGPCSTWWRVAKRIELNHTFFDHFEATRAPNSETPLDTRVSVLLDGTGEVLVFDVIEGEDLESAVAKTCSDFVGKCLTQGQCPSPDFESVPNCVTTIMPHVEAKQRIGHLDYLGQAIS